MRKGMLVYENMPDAGDVVDLYKVGENSDVYMDLVEAGRISPAGLDGWYNFIDENGNTSFIFDNSYLKVDENGNVSAITSLDYERDYRRLPNGQFVVEPEGKLAWSNSFPESNELIDFMIESGQLRVMNSRRGNPMAYKTMGGLDGQSPTYPTDSVIVFDSIERDEDGKLSRVRFTHLSRDEFEDKYTPGAEDADYYKIDENSKRASWEIQEQEDGSKRLVIGSHDKNTIIDTQFLYEFKEAEKQGAFSDVTAMSFDGQVFSDATRLPSFVPKMMESVDFTNFNLGAARTLRGLCFDCDKLKEVKGLGTLNTENIVGFGSMFSGCSSLTSIDFSDGAKPGESMSFKGAKDLCHMFKGCSNLQFINADFNCDKVERAQSMFEDCTNLVNVDLTDMKVDRLSDTAWMFSGCDHLTTLKMNGNFDRLTYAESMFENCKMLTSDLSYFDLSHLEEFDEMFEGSSFEFQDKNKAAFKESFKSGKFFMMNNLSPSMFHKGALTYSVDIPRGGDGFETKSPYRMVVPILAVKEVDTPDGPKMDLKLGRNMSYTIVDGDSKYKMSGADIRENFELFSDHVEEQKANVAAVMATQQQQQQGQDLEI